MQEWGFHLLNSTGEDATNEWPGQLEIVRQAEANKGLDLHCAKK